MTIQAINGMFCLPAMPNNQAGTIGDQSVTLNAVGEMLYIIGYVGKAGTIDSIDIGMGSSNPVDNILTGSMYTIDSTGSISIPGSVISGATGTINVNAQQNKYVTTSTFSTPQVVARGDLICIVIELTTYVSGSVNIMRDAEHNQTVRGLIPYGGEDLSAGSWTNRPTFTIIPVYDDNTYAAMHMFGSLRRGTAASNVDYSNSTSITRIGTRFQIPFPAQLTGCWFAIDRDSDTVIKLYNDAGTLLNTLTGTVLAKTNHISVSSISDFVFDEAVDLAKDTYYRLVMEPSTSTSSRVQKVDYGTAARLNVIPNGSNMTWTDYDGTWNDSTTEYLYCGLYFSGFDDATGGGGGGTDSILGGGGFGGLS